MTTQEIFKIIIVIGIIVFWMLSKVYHPQEDFEKKRKQ